MGTNVAQLMFEEKRIASMNNVQRSQKFCRVQEINLYNQQNVKKQEYYVRNIYVLFSEMYTVVSVLTR